MHQTLIATALSVCLLGSLSSRAALAQIIPDTTWGAENSIATPNATVKGQPATLIEGGAIRNTNLFHSFQTLNIGDGQRVYFASPTGVQTILSRVTGNAASNILGTLGVDGAANLFLINSNGIIFGSNARLDVNGSFVATTANGIQFGNQGLFTVANPQAPPLLTINPSALWFNQTTAQPIINRSIADTAGLRTASGQSLLLVGGQVQLEGGRIVAPGSRVELAGIANGLVGLQLDNNQWQVIPNEAVRADVVLTNNAQVNVRSNSGGDIIINAKNFTMNGTGTQLLAGINSGLGAPETQAGTIAINTTESTSLDASLIDNSVLSGAVGRGGDIRLTTNSLSMTNGGQFRISLLGQGTVGNVAINARDTVFFDGVGTRGRSGVLNVVEQGAIGNSGDISVTARSLIAQNGARLLSSTRGQGNAGKIDVDATDSIFLLGVNPRGFTSTISNQVGPDGVGTTGGITLTTGSLLMRDGAALNTSTSGQGNAGKLNITARDTVLLDGISNTRFPLVTFASSSVNDGAIGNGGDITIATRVLLVRNGAGIVADSAGKGNAGNINIVAEDLAAWEGTVRGFPSSAATVVSSFDNEPGFVGKAAGNGGNLSITARNVSLADGAFISAEIDGAAGRAGNIIINATETVSLSGFEPVRGRPTAFSTFTFGALAGAGGDILVTANALKVSDGALINARSFSPGRGGTINVNVDRLEIKTGGELLTTASSTGNAGSIAVNARDQIVITGLDPNFSARQRLLAQFDPVSRKILSATSSSSGLFASTDANSAGSSGTIAVNTGQLLVQDGGQISVASQGNAAAGQIDITARAVQLQNQGRITAETASSTGGNINLDVRDVLLLRRNSLISATAGTAASGGDGGNLRINAGFVVAHPLENSDITANAFSGRGGRVDLSTLGLFGFTPRSRLDLELALQTTDPDRLNPQQLPTSDITAISQTSPTLSGTVTINTPDLDPTQSLTQLPDVPVDASRLINQQLCAATQDNQFVITGRGGLPDSPTAMLNPTVGWEDWRMTESARAARSPQSFTTETPAASMPLPRPERMVEAQGWLRASDGTIWLTATPTVASPTLPGMAFLNLLACQSSDRVVKDSLNVTSD